MPPSMTPRHPARKNRHTGASSSSPSEPLAIAVNTSPQILHATPRPVTGASPFSLTSPRGRKTPKSGSSSQCLWILMVLLLGIFNVVYQWGNNQEGEVGMLTVLSKNNNNQASIGSTAEEEVIDFPFAPPTQHSAVVFYHIFLPPTQAGQENSARIIQEQLTQLEQSQQFLTIYYNTIGEETPLLNATHIQDYCQQHSQNLICIHMEHFPEGMEDKTLQRLHDFCTLQEEENDNYSILYLHNKGSFSTKPLNEAWRYQMTQSVVTPQCQSAVASQSQQCNLCGLWFSAERGMFMAGNMWRTQCHYVQQLIPPRRFQAAMHQVTAEAMMERLRFKLLMSMQELRAGVFGIDRYATEFWIASHPTVRPCDFSKAIAPLPAGKTDITDHFLQWLRKMGGNYQSPLRDEWFAEQAPSHPLPLPASAQVSQFPDVRLREYFLLAGNLFRWYFLYQQAPASDSWVYQWFPDGSKWRDAVETYGNESVAKVTAEALQQEVISGRNRYTADHSKKLVAKGGPKATPKKRTPANMRRGA